MLNAEICANSEIDASFPVIPKCPLYDFRLVQWSSAVQRAVRSKSNNFQSAQWT